MISLLKADLSRMIKDKLFLVSCIVAGVFAIITPVLYKGLAMLLEIEGEDMLFGSMFTSKGMLTSLFSPTNNLGFIIPVFLGIIISKDFSYGTVRNKIISGKSRVKIYLSILLSSIIIISILMIAYAIISMAIATLLLGYSSDVSIWQELGYVALSILFGVIIFIFIACLLVFFSIAMKNFGGALVMYFVVIFIFVMLGTLTPIAAFYFKYENEALYELFTFLGNINIFYYPANVIGVLEKYKLSNALYLILSSITFGGLLSLLGIHLFNKKDLK